MEYTTICMQLSHYVTCWSADATLYLILQKGKFTKSLKEILIELFSFFPEHS